jgi:hypothetical protein
MAGTAGFVMTPKPNRLLKHLETLQVFFQRVVLNLRRNNFLLGDVEVTQARNYVTRPRKDKTKFLN